jgi:hypothetical protein
MPKDAGEFPSYFLGISFLPLLLFLPSLPLSCVTRPLLIAQPSTTFFHYHHHQPFYG